MNFVIRSRNLEALQKHRNWLDCVGCLVESIIENNPDGAYTPGTHTFRAQIPEQGWIYNQCVAWDKIHDAGTTKTSEVESQTLLEYLKSRKPGPFKPTL